MKSCKSENVEDAIHIALGNSEGTSIPASNWCKTVEKFIKQFLKSSLSFKCTYLTSASNGREILKYWNMSCFPGVQEAPTCERQAFI